MSKELLLPDDVAATTPMVTQHSPFRYSKTNPEIICLAKISDIRRRLSLRNLQDIVHERGIEISD